MNQRHPQVYVLLPIIHRECGTFFDLWNSHGIRSQNNLELPNGVPNHMFSFPEQYRGTQKGIPITTEFLQKVSTNRHSVLIMEVLYMTSWMKNS